MKIRFRQFVELLTVMTAKELHTRYKYTLFGFFWLVITPVLQMLVIGFVFSFLLKEPTNHYFYFLFLNLLLWNFFALSVAKATPSIVYERDLIKKARFPHAVIPISIIASNAIHLVIATGIFFLSILWLGTFQYHLLPLLLLAFIQLVVFTVGFSLLTTALNVRFRDVNFFVQALLVIWFYATPTMYSLSLLPVSITWLWYLNPLTFIFTAYQQVFLGLPGTNPTLLTANATLIGLTFVLGLAIFIRKSPMFDDWV